MTAFVTYTPNPAIDAWAQVDVVRPTEKMRTGHVRLDPGGGGINVARVLRRLGDEAVAVYVAGGATGPVLETLLQRAGLEGRCVPIAGDTRLSQVVREASTGREFRFVPEGPTVTAGECRAALDMLATTPCAWLAASGSLPAGAPDDHYAQVAEIARARGVRLALDCSGRALAAAVAAGGIAVLKPSRHELGQLVGRSLEGGSDVEEAAAALVAKGRVAQVAVSLGPEGAVVVTAQGVWRCAAPAASVVSTVGAGDSFLAGYLHAIAAGEEPARALQVAVAAGTAACLHPGTQLAAREDVERLLSAMGQPTPAG